MSQTTRKYYIRLDASSKDLLPGLCRANNDHVNRIIADDRKITDKLKELRREDPKTRAAQKELDELRSLREEKWEEVRIPGDEALARLRGALKRAKDEKKTEAGKEYRALRKEISKARSDEMMEYLESIDYFNRYKVARRVVDSANKKDFNPLSSQALKDLKSELGGHANPTKNYHIDAYHRNDLRRSREATRDFAARHPFRALQKNPDQKVQFRSFELERGYGTNLPSDVTLETGHSQAPGNRYTLAEFRAGDRSRGANRVFRRLDFPKQSAWDETRPKGERKKDQFGQVEFFVMGQVLRGSCYFHQQAPDTHQVNDAKLKIEVCKGNVQCFLILVLADKEDSERSKLLKSYDYNYDLYQKIDLEATQSEETLLEILNICKRLKGPATRKKMPDLVQQVTTTQETAKRLLSETRKGTQS